MGGTVRKRHRTNSFETHSAAVEEVNRRMRKTRGDARAMAREFGNSPDAGEGEEKGVKKKGVNMIRLVQPI